MNHGSLFSGIGGFDLAAEWAGWTNVFHCEWNPFGQKVLKHYWPNAESFNDITKTDFTTYANKIDILTGGFPCQPYSSAGKRKGKEDERHLWPEMLRAIREISPRWIVGENVLGLVNWSRGLVFHEVQADLEAAGYEVQPFLLPAAAVDAPHRRDRIFFVAYSNSRGLERAVKVGRNGINVKWKSKFGNATNTDSNGLHKRNSNYEINASERGINAQRNIEPGIINGDATDTRLQRQEKCEKQTTRVEQCGEERDVPNTNNEGLERWKNESNYGSEKTKRKQCNNFTRCFRSNFRNFPTQSPICGGDDGLPTELDGITFSKWRNESIKAYGNAVVPQVVYQIFKAINEYESTTL